MCKSLKLQKNWKRIICLAEKCVDYFRQKCLSHLWIIALKYSNKHVGSILQELD